MSRARRTIRNGTVYVWCAYLESRIDYPWKLLDHYVFHDVLCAPRSIYSLYLPSVRHLHNEFQDTTLSESGFNGNPDRGSQWLIFYTNSFSLLNGFPNR